MLEFICGIFAGGIIVARTLALCKAGKTEETDSRYRTLYRALMEQPNCNNCGDGECPYRPEWGAAVRINCPLHVKGEDGGDE